MALRVAARKDANHSEIVNALRKIGAYVLDISQLKNCCDIFVGYRGKWTAMEIKDGNKPASARKLTPGEKEFFEAVYDRAPAVVVNSVDEAITAITI